MNVYILEDELTHHKRISNIFSKVQGHMKSLFPSLFYFETVEKLLASKVLFKENDVFILDIDIHGNKKAGLQLASMLRRQFEHVTIIFLTAHGSLIKDIFGHRAFPLDFIDKSLSDEEIIERLIRCFSYVEATNNFEDPEKVFLFSSKQTAFNVPKSEIILFETLPNRHRLRLFTKQESMEFTSSLADIEKLDPSFIRCHKAYVVNWMNVVRIDKSQKLIHLLEGHSCPVSRQQYKKILEMY